ncbi:phosphatidate cytidylyltransferase [Novipirellula sp.]|uniref:phosphatidate cytidylyltransferase n=1 Tax=Novipirellula sp. TaxID=2795430 RepID=UPI00356431D3
MPLFPIPSHVQFAAMVAVSALLVGTCVRLVAIRGQAPEIAQSRLRSLKSWWIVTLVVIASALLGRLAMVAVVGMVSCLALREFVALPLAPAMPLSVTRSMYGLIVISYVAVAMQWASFFVIAVPLLSIAIPSLVLIVSGQVDAFLRHIGRITFVVMVTTYGIGHIALLVTLPESTNPQSVNPGAVNPGAVNPASGPAGLFLFLIAVTEINDIAQAMVGRRFGRRKLTPVSPKKTWEGFGGGMVVTSLIAMLLGHWLIAMTPLQSFIAGILMSIAGQIGDLNMSAMKREIGVKDSGNLLPGQGGILDRIDSLTFTAPLFFYYFQWMTR